MADDQDRPAPSAAQLGGPTVQELLAADSRETPVALRDTGYVYLGSGDLPKGRYTSAQFAELEAEYLWSRTWQFAAMECDLVKAGDHVVYDVAGESLIVVRGDDGVIRAFHNACLHRATKLRVADGRVGSFRCPFHGWRWDLRGELTELPCQWDFAFLHRQGRTALPQAQVATWGGFVFVNMDPAAQPFEQAAAKLIGHFADFPLERRYRAFWAVKEVPANWKACREAFAEGYHVIATHPQIVSFTGDANSEYANWPDAPLVTRQYNPFGLASPHLGGQLSEQDVADAYLRFFTGARRGSGPAAIDVTVGDGVTARQAVAAALRPRLGAAYGVDLDATSDAELLDAVLYHLFPAFTPWATVGQPLVYRWRPGATPDTCFMDVIRMAPIPTDGRAWAPAPCTRLALDQSWREAPGMGGLADVFEQDMENLPKVQAGLRSRGKAGVSLGDYQEAGIRQHHRQIDRLILAGLAADGRPRSEVERFLVPD